MESELKRCPRCGCVGHYGVDMPDGYVGTDIELVECSDCTFQAIKSDWQTRTN